MNPALVNPAELIPLEDYDRERAKWLSGQILRDNKWTQPIVISPEMFIMDGHHRREAALLLNLKLVPCITFSYSDVEVYSLRDNYVANAEAIFSNHKEGIIFPYKTAKHVFPEYDIIHVHLSELQ